MRIESFDPLELGFDPSTEGIDVSAMIAPEDRFDREERAALAEALERHLTALEPHVAVLDAARSLKEAGASMVLCEATPAYGGGPLSTLHDAVFAMRLASRLSEQWGRAVVPVLWNDADDHELRSVHPLFVVNPNFDRQRVGMSAITQGRRPLNRFVLEAEHHQLDAAAAALRQILDEAPFRDEQLRRFLPRDGDTFASAFTRAWTDLLGPRGLLVIEPSQVRGELSRALAHLVGFRREGPADLLGGEVAGGADEGPGAALVYRIEGGKRHALRPGGDGFRYDDEPGSRSPRELAAAIVSDLADYSAGRALLAPARDLALPIAARVEPGRDRDRDGGSPAGARRTDRLRIEAAVPRPPVFRRAPWTIVGGDVRGALARADLELDDALLGRGRLAEAAKASAGSPAGAVELRHIAKELRAKLLAQREPVAELDRGLAIQVKRTAQRVSKTIEELATKIERVAANRSGKLGRHVRQLDARLFPGKTPQEEGTAVLEALARHGTDWIDGLLEAHDPGTVRALVIHLGL